MDVNNVQRMQLCLKILTNPKLLKSVNGVQKILAEQGKKIFQKFLESHSRLIKDPSQGKKELMITQPDETLSFRQLKGRSAVTDFDVGDEVTADTLGEGFEDFLGDVKKEQNAKVYQLTGFSDDIYAEAFVEVHHYDILLNI